MLALIDGDVIAHMCCKSRFSKPAAKGQLYTEIIHVVPNKDDVEFSKEDDREYLEESWENFQKQLEKILEDCFAEEFLMAVKHSYNFRDDMYPIEVVNDKAVWGYKANRWKPEGQSNKFVPAIRELAQVAGLAIPAVGREADDLLRIWAEQARAVGDQYVIVSIDKDLKCIPGTHYNIKSRQTTTVTEHEAMRFFYQQLLSGDPTDNIPGVPGIGPVKSEKLLYNLSTEEEYQEVVAELYMSAYEDSWYEMLLSNGKMLYLQKHESDFFQVSHWPVVQALSASGKRFTPVVPALVADAPTAPSPILAPSAPAAPRLAPKTVQPEAVPEKACAATEGVPKPVSTLSFKIPPLKG